MLSKNENPRAGSAGAQKNLQTKNSKSSIDFKAINRAALFVLPCLIRHLLPHGEKAGKEWIARNPLRPDAHGGSFSINMRTGKWADFATGDAGGDIISLVAYLNGIRQGEAAKRLAIILGVTNGK